MLSVAPDLPSVHGEPADAPARRRRSQRKFSLAALSSRRPPVPPQAPAIPETVPEQHPPVEICPTTQSEILQSVADHLAENDAAEGEASTIAANKSIRTDRWLDEDLIVEHFGFHPIQFVDEVFGAINEIMYTTLEEFENFVDGEFAELERSGGAQILDPDEVTNGMAKLETLMFNAIDKNFDKFEIFALRNIFRLPSDRTIVLPHYENVDLNASEDEEARLDEEIAAVLKETVIQKHLSKLLERQLKSLKQRNPTLLRLKDSIEAVFTKTSTEAVSSLPEKVRLLQAGMQSLRDSSAAALQRAEKVRSVEETVARSQRDIMETAESVNQYLKKLHGNSTTAANNDVEVDDELGEDDLEEFCGSVAVVLGEIKRKVDAQTIERAMAIGGVPEALIGQSLFQSAAMAS